MASDATTQALLERTRSREEELRRKEKDFKLREQQLRERAEELDVAKASVENLMKELRERELQVCEVEKKHGILQAREDEVQNRQMMMLEREMQLQELQAEYARQKAQDLSASKIREKEVQDKIAALLQRDLNLARRESEMNAIESETTARANTLAKRISDFERDALLKESQIRDVERKTQKQHRETAQKQHEVEQAQFEIQERMKVLKAEIVDIETRDRDLKWKEEQIASHMQEISATKSEQMKWSAKLSEHEERFVAQNAELERNRYALQQQEADLCRRMQLFLEADAEICEREDKIRHLDAAIQHRLALCERRTAETQEKQAHLSAALENAANTRDNLANLEAELHHAKADYDRKLHILSEKERALKDWLVELEFRSALLEKKENRSNSYFGLQKSTSENPSLRSGKFNSAIVSLQLQSIQGAYLGATMKARLRHTPEFTRKSTPLMQQSISFKKKSLELEIAEEVENAFEEFRDLVGGYAAMTTEEKRNAFSEDGESEIIAAIEHEVQVYDELSFLDAFHFSSLPQIEPSCSLAESSVLRAFEKWAGERQDLIAERRRRIDCSRLGSLQTALSVMRGKVPPREMRLSSLQENRDAITASYRQRARKRLPSIISDAEYEPQKCRPNTTPLAVDRSAHRSAQAEHVVRRGATERLVEALPPYLRHHYSM